MKFKVLNAAAAVMLACTAMPVMAEEDPLPKADLLMVRLSVNEEDPLAVIKEAVIEDGSEKGLVDPEEIDVERSRIELSSYEDGKTGMIKAEVSVYLATSDSDTDFAVSFTEPVVLSIDSDEYPRLFLTTESVTVEPGESFDPLDFIASVGETGKALPILTIDNPVNTEEPGDYTVTYTARNSSGLATVRTLEVSVARTVILNGQTVSETEVVMEDEALIMEMFNAINEVRAAYGLYPYKLADEDGQTVAAIRAMEAYGYTAHYRPDGRYYLSAFDDLGVDRGNYCYEILVKTGGDVQSNLNWWLNEPGHARYVLDSQHYTIAIGHYGTLWSAEIYN